MRNHDEALLRGRRILHNAPWPALHQALRIALYQEYAARAFHRRVSEAFPGRAPFAECAQAAESHIAELGRLCERYGVARPLDPFPMETRIAADWRGNLERAAVGELDKAGLYAALAAASHALPDVQRRLAGLQQAALSRCLPALQRALQDALSREQYHAAQGLPPEAAYVRHGPLTRLVEHGFTLLARQHGVLGLAGTLIRAAHPAMLAGAAAGGLAVHGWRKQAARRKAASDSFFSPTDLTED